MQAIYMPPRKGTSLLIAHHEADTQLHTTARSHHVCMRMHQCSNTTTDIIFLCADAHACSKKHTEAKRNAHADVPTHMHTHAITGHYPAQPQTVYVQEEKNSGMGLGGGILAGCLAALCCCCAMVS